MAARIKTGGGRFDPAEPFCYFLAGVSNTPGMARHHGHVLCALNDVMGDEARYSDLPRIIAPDHVRLFLDSGVFWLSTRHAKANGLTMDEALALPPDQLDGWDKLTTLYVDTVRALEPLLWGYIELDQGGAHVKRQTRAWLESEGLKPIPVYHPLVDGWDYFDELVDRYDRICVGNLVQASQTTRDKIIVTLHERLRRLKPARRPWVHLLGLGPYRTLAACPVNSCDTSNHVQSMRWGAIVPGAQALGAFSRLYGFLYDRERYDDPVIGYHAYGELISYLGHLDERSWRNFLSDRESILGLPVFPPLERGEPATLTPASVTP